MFQKIELQIQKTIDYYKHQGLLQFIKHFFNKLGFEHFSRTLIFLVLNLKNIPHDIKEPCDLSIITIDDIEKIRDYNNGVFTKDEAVYRLQKGHTLFFSKESNKMTCSIWIEQQNAAIWWFNNLPLNLPEAAAYMSGLNTSPEYRRKGFASKLKKEVSLHLKKEGVSYLIEGLHPANKPALLMDKKLGFKEYQTIIYKRYWYIRHYTVQRFNSDERKTFITFFKAPKDIWKTYL